MPSIYTHYKFGRDVLSKFSKDFNNNINDDYYNLFNQSFDTLYYYNFLSLKKGRKIREFAHYAHRNNSNLFFSNLIKYIKENNLEHNKEIISMLYGFINHYVLDTTIHPFLNYKTGRFNKHNKSTKKYKGIHPKVEIMIDRYFYEKDTKKDWSNYKIYQDFMKKMTFSPEVKNTLDIVFKETFNTTNMGIIYETSNNQSLSIYKYLMKDKYGIKKIGYQICDFFSPFKDSLYSSYSWHVKPIEKKFLTNNYMDWCNPVDKEIFYTKTFFNLYDESLIYSKTLIEEVNKILYNNKSIKEFLELIGNKNYETGLDLDDKRILQYFEF